MRTPFLLSAFVACTAPAFAVLPPGANASLAQHMLEVNAQWRAQDPAQFAAQYDRTFTNEADRIATHLHLVRGQLASRSGEGLSAEQMNNRLGLLEKLDAYADRGIFPQNYILSYRNPIFIDPHGTACAVGQLIIESGHRDLAERISVEMNLAYLLDMPASHLWPEIAAWAGEHGFTAEELAWIQPGYPPNYDWIPLGGGTNGPVTVVKTLANGNVLVAGDFTQAGGTPTSHVAVWNGTSYSALGTGVQGVVNCAVEFNGKIYIGGAMLNGPADLAKWDGSYWSYSTVFEGKYPLINALHVHNGELYAAGAMSGFAGNTEFVQRMSGATWTPVGSAFDAPVHALATHDGSLIAGGAFSSILGPTLPTVLHVAAFNGTDWVQYGDGLDGTVRTLLDHSGTLYAGGDLYANIAVTFGLARIAASATQWEPLLPNHPGYITQGPGPTYISSLVARADDEIYFGGVFSMSQMVGTYGNNLGRFYGTPDAVAAMIIVDAPVNALAIADEQLVAGGTFEAVYPHVITLDLTTGIDDETRTTFTLAPNPTTDLVRISSTDGDAISGRITITDACGRTVSAPMQRGTGSVAVDVRELPAGVYHVIMKDATPLRFVKQ